MNLCEEYDPLDWDSFRIARNEERPELTIENSF